MADKPIQEDITAPTMKNNETWNTCPECEKDWHDPTSVPGLIHRTKICDACKRKKAHAKP